MLNGKWPFPNPPCSLTYYQAIFLIEALLPSDDNEVFQPIQKKKVKLTSNQYRDFLSIL